MSQEIIENEIFNSTSHKTKKQKKRSKNIILKKYITKQEYNFIIIISKTHEKLSLVTLVTNYHKLLFLPLMVKQWWKFEKLKSV